jgi:hypothetical protein
MTKENVKTLGDFTKKGSDIAQLRLANQRLSGAGFASPVEVVRWFGAMQSQDLPASLYAIGLRMTGATEAIVESALANGSIVRSWPMPHHSLHGCRGRPMVIRMLAPRGIAETLSPRDENQGRRSGALRVLESALTREPRLTRAELYQRLNDEGVATNTPDIPSAVCLFWCIGPRLA